MPRNNNQCNNNQQANFINKRPAIGKIYYKDGNGAEYELEEIFQNIIKMSKDILKMKKNMDKKFKTFEKCLEEKLNTQSSCN